MLGEVPAKLTLGCLIGAVFGSPSQGEFLGTKRGFRS